MVARWLNTNKMQSNTDIKRPLKYITLVFELTSSNIKYATVRHDSFLLSLLGLWSPYVIGQTIYIFILFLLLLSFFSSPNLSSRRLDVYHTSAHGVVLV